MKPYTDRFYQELGDGVRRSAEAIVPLLIDLVHPRSVVDVGCGVGTWLSVFRELGVEDVFGIDGGHVNGNMLEIPEDRFLAFDLTRPLRLERSFDLVVSLEVAEHLSADAAGLYVHTLTRLGPIIVFSAAIPFQEGLHHVNEEWPDYWCDHFLGRGFAPIDCIREKVWQDDRVEWWYAQNTLMFATEEALEESDALSRARQMTRHSQLSLVHPGKYLTLAGEQRETSTRLWQCRRELLVVDIAHVIPTGETFLLVDDDALGLGKDLAEGRSAIPFLERGAQYWGPPADDAIAIRELERLRENGASFIVFAWPCFWWLEHYAEFRDFLRAEYRVLLENDRSIIFDLRSTRS